MVRKLGGSPGGAGPAGDPSTLAEDKEMVELLVLHLGWLLAAMGHAVLVSSPSRAPFEVSKEHGVCPGGLSPGGRAWGPPAMAAPRLCSP